MNFEENHQDEKDDSGIEQDQQWIFIRIAIEDHHLQKVLKFALDETVWNAKQKIFQVLLRELPDHLNYGLYLPPSNGRAGKFLDECRCLKEYPLNGPVSYLELKYKRRVYKSINLIQKNLNFKINVKKFVDAIQMNEVEKVSRYLEKGFDPNIHLSDDQTPLVCASLQLFEPRSMLMTLVNGGAHLDFRTRRGGLTPLHYAAIYHRKEAIRTLLELGASTNVYDEKNLTPLYHCVMNQSNEFNVDSSYCCLLLLQDHSKVDCQDQSLSTELHQASRLGLVQHLEHLLFYRANINATNSAGNTPLHICALTNQESCARILLFRGADTTIVNKANQTPYELALVSQNPSVASLIESHKADCVVPFRESPLINPKRRSIYFDRQREKSRRRSSSNTNCSLSLLASRSQSMPKLTHLHLTNQSSSTSSEQQQQSMEHYFSSQQGTSSRSSSPKSFSVNSDQGFSSESTSHFSSNCVQVINGSSYSSKRKRLYAAAPGRKCLCIKSYRSNSPGELNLRKGDIIEILSVGEEGFLEGRCQDNEGWFPTHHVQDISVFKNGDQMSKDETIVISRDALSALMINNDHFSPRTIVLQRGKKGFGFVLRGSRVAGKLFQASPSFPALQFLDSIEKGSNADKAGLKQNDYVLQINGINVISMPHEECVQLIKRAGDTLALKVVTAQLSSSSSSPMSQSQSQSQSQLNSSNNCSQSLPYRRKAPLRPGLEQTFNDDLDRTLGEYEYGSLIDSTNHLSQEYLTIPKQNIENSSNGCSSSSSSSSSSSILSKTKPLVPERDSSLYESLISTQNPCGYQTFRPSNVGSTTTTNLRRNSNSSSNEGDEESSLSSSNSYQNPICNEQINEENNNSISINPSISIISTNMSTFKTTTTTISNSIPSKPSEVKRRSNYRKQNCSTSNSTNSIVNSSLPTTTSTSTTTTTTIKKEIDVNSSSCRSIPPPPPFPKNFDETKKCEDTKSSNVEDQCSISWKSMSNSSTTSDFQSQIAEAKSRLKKSDVQLQMSSSTTNKPLKTSDQFDLRRNPHSPSSQSRSFVIEDICPSSISGFPPPPSPTTLRRSISSQSPSSSSSSLPMDPRLDVNFSAVIAKRAAESKARRYENPIGLEFQSNGLPPSTTFFNSCVTTNGVQQHLNNSGSSCQQRFSATANQLLENLKRRSGNGNSSAIVSLVQHFNEEESI